MFKCKKCGETFDSRSDLGKHLHMHKQEYDRGDFGKFIIPVDSVEELKYLKVGQVAKIMCVGFMTDQGLAVTDSRYM